MPLPEHPLTLRLGAEFFRTIPRGPGVYFMLDEDDDLLYIGKAKSLRKRLSSYRRIRPGSAELRLVRLVDKIRRIRWEECRTEADALIRERELLHAVRPPYNIKDTQESHYFFIAVEELPGGRRGQRLRFELTSDPDDATEERAYGCFKHWGMTKQGYCALLRLLYVCQARTPRFHIPARLARGAPAYRYETEIPADWRPLLHRFLSGSSLGLLREISLRLAENENVPRFMYPGIRDDLDTAREFYAFGPRATRQLRLRAGLRAGSLSMREMDEIITAELRRRMAG